MKIQKCKFTTLIVCVPRVGQRLGIPVNSQVGMSPKELNEHFDTIIIPQNV